MQYDVATPKEYIEALEEDWRKEKLLQIRELLLSKEHGLEEVIEYKMLGYKGKGEHLFSLNAQQNYVSFYVGDTKKVDPNGELLKGASLGKGCIRFKKTLALSDTRIDEFISRAVQLWREGEDIGC